MKVEVHIKDQSFVINCGEGNQKIRWLGDVAVFRYEQFFEPVNGCPKGVKFETGDLLPMDGIINQVLDDEMHIWVILKEDMEGLGLDKEKKNISNNTQSNAFRIRPGTAFTNNQSRF